MNNEESLNIIYQTVDYLVVNKPSGLLSQKSTNENNSVLGILNKSQASKYFHLLTRLDRPVSGVLLVSKKNWFTQKYIQQQNREDVLKTYLAIIEGKLEKDKQDLVHFHHHDKKWKKARLSDDEIQGSRKIRMQVRVLKKLDRYTIVELQLNRGAFHQIRSQLAHLGHPIKGDVKYGARRGNKDRSIYLHSYSIKLRHKEKLNEHIATLPKNDNLWAIADDLLKKNDG